MSWMLTPVHAQKKVRQAHRSLICFAMVKKACSTFVAFFADVSRKGMESWSAKSWIIDVSDAFKLDLIRRKTRTDLRRTILHDLLAREVRFVTNKQLVHALRSVAVDLLQPLLDVGERIYRKQVRGWSRRPEDKGTGRCQ